MRRPRTALDHVGRAGTAATFGGVLAAEVGVVARSVGLVATGVELVAVVGYVWARSCDPTG
jgi:hypothetical protein